MGERKVLNRYIPPDFDPSIIPKFKRDRSKMIEVRMMLPFSLRCNTCSEYMYRGKKFNSKVERTEEYYMGIRKLRFYIKCSVCSAEITFKTDPQNADYECESGASRNFEIWRDTQSAIEEEAKEREEDAQDAMKALEHKTMDNKTEMDVLDALDEIKAINQRHRRVDTNKVLEIIANKQQQQQQQGGDREKDKQLTEQDEALIKSIHFGRAKQREDLLLSSSSSVLSGGAVSATDDLVSRLQREISSSHTQTHTQTQTQKPLGATLIVRKKRKADENKTEDAVANKKSAVSVGESNRETVDDTKTVAAIEREQRDSETGTEKAIAAEAANEKATETAADAESDAGGALMGLLGDYGADSE